MDQGTEFVSNDLIAYQRGVALDFSRPGRPTGDSFVDSFNGMHGAEHLNANRFMSLDDARQNASIDAARSTTNRW